MVPSFLASAFMAMGVFHFADAQSKICKAASCDDCPVTTTDSGIGFPDCTIYNSADVFTGLFDKNEETGTWDVWFDVPEHENPECNWIIKSPASVGIDTCGETMWYGRGGSCRSLQIKDTFMLQFCCGFGDCCGAGINNLPGCGNSKRSLKRDLMSSPIFSLRSNSGEGRVEARASGSGSLMLVDKDGNPIQPAEQGTPQAARRDTISKDTPEVLKPRDGVCVSGSWTDSGSEFITTSPYTQAVSDTRDGGTEGAVITITEERSSSWSTTMETSIGFADIFSMGISFSVEQSESISTSEAAQFTIPAGQKGYVAWTGFVLCKEGAGECNGGTVSGRVCIPYDSNGGPAGEFHLVQAG